MHEALGELCAALDKVVEAIRAHSSDSKSFSEIYGHWNIAQISPAQAANRALIITFSIKDAKIENLGPAHTAIVKALTKSVNDLQGTIIPHLFNGNAQATMNPFLETLNYVQSYIDYMFGFATLKDRNAYPRHIVKRINAAQEAVDSAIENADGIEDKMAKIQSAYDAAEELPTTLDELNKAKRTIATIQSNVEQALGRVNSVDTEAANFLSKMAETEKSAAGIVRNCEDAYRITTSKGLAASFEESARKLNTSIKWWIAGLLVALGATGLIGYSRLDLVNEIVSKPDAPASVIIGKLFVTLLGVGPAIWFAWLATKQIGQRFRMAEDYTFKASVAKAYEGYRKEAARIDPKFEAQLFGSALSRVDEAPLRLVEPHSYGSPMQEALGEESLISRTFSSVKNRVAAKPPKATQSEEKKAQNSAAPADA